MNQTYWEGNLQWFSTGPEPGRGQERMSSAGDVKDVIQVMVLVLWQPVAGGWTRLAVAGCRAWHVAPAPAGCCLKPPNKILRFSCHAAFLHSNSQTTTRSTTILVTADIYLDI